MKKAIFLLMLSIIAVIGQSSNAKKNSNFDHKVILSNNVEIVEGGRNPAGNEVILTYVRFSARLQLPNTTYGQDITITARLDVSQVPTPAAKYITLVIPQGNLATIGINKYNISNGYYQLYDVTINPSTIDLQVNPIYL